MAMERTRIPLGFFLERLGVSLLPRPSVPYRGIDRLPFVPDAVETQGRTSEVGALWDRYHREEYEGTLFANLTLARELASAFTEFGVEVEVIYAEVHAIPADFTTIGRDKVTISDIQKTLERVEVLRSRLESVPANPKLLGYDLSYPLPTFHSAIYQPGLHESHPELIDHLNGEGLFENLSALSPYLEIANDMPHSWVPFCALAIYVP